MNVTGVVSGVYVCIMGQVLISESSGQEHLTCPESGATVCKLLREARCEIRVYAVGRRCRIARCARCRAPGEIPTRCPINPSPESVQVIGVMNSSQRRRRPTLQVVSSSGWSTPLSHYRSSETQPPPSSRSPQYESSILRAWATSRGHLSTMRRSVSSPQASPVYPSLPPSGEDARAPCRIR